MSKNKKMFQAPKGMRDILPEEQKYWDWIYQVIKKVTRAYGFEKISTPIVEDMELFVKGTGATTDIVEKEMYILKTRGGDRLSLRPEFTPGIMRAYYEHGMFSWPQPVSLYSFGPVFRYDKPQSGRYRQFYQANFEIIGEKDPILDTRLIQLFYSIIGELGLRNIITQINSIGCKECRPSYRRKLIDYYKREKENLCVNCQNRLIQNPLRLLDCKESKCIKLAEKSPQMIDYLCDDCRNHFRAVLEYLDELNIPYILNHRLVRGLDYYTKTVFEFSSEEKETGRQDALAGGGRYDGLANVLGNRDIPAVGFASGVERIISLIKKRNIKVPLRPTPRIFLVQLGSLAKKKSLKLFEELRRSGLDTATSFSRDTIKSQLKLADKLGVRFALILGQKEALDETIIIRDMKSGDQENVPLIKVVKELKKRMR